MIRFDNIRPVPFSEQEKICHAYVGIQGAALERADHLDVHADAPTTPNREPVVIERVCPCGRHFAKVYRDKGAANSAYRLKFCDDCAAG